MSSIYERIIPLASPGGVTLMKHGGWKGGGSGSLSLTPSIILFNREQWIEPKESLRGDLRKFELGKLINDNSSGQSYVIMNEWMNG